MLKRSHQLNQYTITKTNSITLPTPSFSSPSFLLYKTYNPITGKSKLLLKVIIISLTVNSSEAQKRFGFTFIMHHHYQQQQDDAKFALAPDSLVKEALSTWINSQNEQLKGGAPFLVSFFFFFLYVCVFALTSNCKITNNSHYYQNLMKS